MNRHHGRPHVAPKRSEPLHLSVGIVKREYLPKIKDPVAYELMKTLKRTLDPKGILNPGKVL